MRSLWSFAHVKRVRTRFSSSIEMSFAQLFFSAASPLAMPVLKPITMVFSTGEDSDGMCRVGGKWNSVENYWATGTQT